MSYTASSTYILSGADPTGATDSTAAFAAAIANVSGGTIVVPPGIYSANIVINKHGIILDFGGGHQLTSGTLRYIKPFDPTKPTIQISDDTSVINGSGVRNVMMYNQSGSGQKGIVFAGGAQKCFVNNIQSLGFTKTCLEFRNDDANPCTFNLAEVVVCSTNVAGAAGIAFIDVHSAATATGCSTSGTTLTVGTLSTGTISIGAPVSGTNVVAGTKIVAQLTGTPGGAGTYTTNTSSSVTITGTATFGGNGWTTANQISNFNSTASNGYQVYCESAQTNSLSNGYIQSSISGQSIKFYQPQGRLYSPRVNFSNVDVDNVSNGNGTVSTVVDCYNASDYRVAAQFNNLSPFMGQYNSAANMFAVAGNTTGSITTGTATLTVASATGIFPDRWVMIYGSGTSGTVHISKVVSVSGTTITIANNAVLTTSSVQVSYGDVCPLETKGAGASWLNAPGIGIGNCNKEGLQGRNYPVLYGPNATMTVQPWNDYSPIFDTGIRNFHILQQAPSLTISSITQSTTVVTVTTSSNHNMGVGDIFAISGCNEVGVNGTFAVATYVSATSFTYTSGTSQTLGSVTGTPIIIPYKQITFNATSGRMELNINGLGMRNNSGTVNRIIYGSNSSANLQHQTPDQSSGFFTMTFGSGITTGTGIAFGTPAANKAWISGNGVFKLLLAAAPSTDSTAGQFYANSSTLKNHVRDSLSGDGAIVMAPFIATADKTIANTGSATSMFGTGTGSISFSANSLGVSRVIEIDMAGFLSCVSGPTASIIVKLGSTTIATIPAAALATTLTNAQFTLSAKLTLRTTGASGTIRGHVKFHYDDASAGGKVMWDNTTANVTIDTTAIQALDTTWTWGTPSASNTITIDEAIVKYI